MGFLSRIYGSVVGFVATAANFEGDPPQDGSKPPSRREFEKMRLVHRDYQPDLEGNLWKVETRKDDAAGLTVRRKFKVAGCLP